MSQLCILTILAKIKFSIFYSIKAKYSLKNVFLQNTTEPELKVTQSALVKHHICI